jgi:hypothetical protein
MYSPLFSILILLIGGEVSKTNCGEGDEAEVETATMFVILISLSATNILQVYIISHLHTKSSATVVNLLAKNRLSRTASDFSCEI